MKDAITSVSGNKMVQLRQEIVDLHKRLAELSTELDAEEISALKKTIVEKETYYNILADRVRVGGRPM